MFAVVVTASQYDKICESVDGFNGTSTAVGMKALGWNIKTQSVLSNIEPGCTKDEVLAVIKEHDWPDSQLSIEGSEILLHAPVRIGKSTLAAQLHFSDGKLISAAMQKSDGTFSPYQLSAPSQFD